MIFRHSELFPHLSTMQNLTLAQVKGIKHISDEANDRGRKLRDRIGLAKILHH